jgi:hypothetical protein
MGEHDDEKEEEDGRSDLWTDSCAGIDSGMDWEKMRPGRRWSTSFLLMSPSL